MRIATHQEPVWRSRANFIFHAYVDGDPNYREQLWGRRVEPGLVELCCIPFLLYDIALGDLVRTNDQNILEAAVERRGRVAFRFWLHEAELGPSKELASRLVDMGALVEWSSPHLLSIDAADQRLARVVAGALSELENAGIGVYETADRAHPSGVGSTDGDGHRSV
ncbi:DUF4265 domain-containing protein [Leifsonia sp. ZF2019]|uniref:DUF4265 domain-containing protein n=1 Tax=Leifsonia sp. ZF2019 TaxID=2781978 RepID=UPI002377B947|nr:DUF4265 domain-containing protein [Leifsonia sp. ZF2019]